MKIMFFGIFLFVVSIAFSQPETVQVPVSDEAGTCYAVIISGGKNREKNYKRYWNNCSLLYKTLVQKYKYKRENIYVLMSDGTNPGKDRLIASGKYDSSPLDLNGDGIDDVKYAATKANVSAVFDELSGKVTERDNVLVFTTGHGDKERVIYTIYWLWNDVSMNEQEFAAEIHKLQKGTVNVVMSQCYSGGLVSKVDRPNTIITTACSGTEKSLPHPSLEYDNFVFYWMSAVSGYSPDGLAVTDVDLNGDKYISMFEAHKYADANRIGEEMPRLYTSEYFSYLKNDLTLSGLEVCSEAHYSNIVDQDKEYTGCEVTVTSNVKSGAKLTIKARSSITLKPGFEMESGGVLETEIKH